MNWINFVLGLLCTYTAYYLVLILWDHLRRKRAAVETNAGEVKDYQGPQRKTCTQNEKTANGMSGNDSVLRSLQAYDNSGHKSLVHVRFDKQTVDLMNKFKLATGVHRGKFVAFAVNYFFQANPQLKSIIKQYLKNTEL